jgi:transcriptional regulator with XRE-family HTH domain
MTRELDTNASRPELKREFQDEDYRYAYAEDFLNTVVATQIVALREQRGLSQSELGEAIGTKQPGVSRLENVNHSTWKTETLKKIARALGVRLRISFETFGSLLDEDERFSREFLRRPTFHDDPAFCERKEPVSATSTVVPFVKRAVGQTEQPQRRCNDIVGIGERFEFHGVQQNVIPFPYAVTD